MAILVNRSKNHNIFEMENLSFKAKGLYLQMSRCKRKSPFGIETLINKAKDNRVSVYAGLKELEDAELFYRIPIRKGKISHYVYILLSQPTDKDEVLNGIFLDRLLAEFLQAENLHVVLTSNIGIGYGNSINLEYSKVSYVNFELKKLLDYWQKNITKHDPKKKTYKLGMERLERKYRHINRKQLLIKRKVWKASYGFKKIILAMRLYKKLLNDGRTIFSSSLPWKVSLPIFFSFNSYIKDNHSKQLEGVGSWYAECCKGESYCFDRYGRHTVLESMFLKKYPTKDEELLSKATQRFIEFHEGISDKLNLPNRMDEKYATRFTKYLFKFIDKKFRGRKFKLFILLNRKFLNIEFTEYLQDMDWIK